MRRVIPVPLAFLLPLCVGCGSSPSSAPATFPTRPNPPITINMDALGMGKQGDAKGKEAKPGDAKDKETPKEAKPGGDAKDKEAPKEAKPETPAATDPKK